MNLPQTLAQIARDFNLDENLLNIYANEDTQTGWDEGMGAWPIGSLWRVEGQVLYALIRLTKPQRVLELGTYHGCSATHILMALAANGEGGKLTAVDNNLRGIEEIGHMIPDRLRDNLTLHNLDVYEFVTRQSKGINYDFVFSDAAHSDEQIASIWSQRDKMIAPGGFLIEHDALHFLVGEAVMRGIHSTGANPFTYLTEPSDCGLAIWRYDELLVPEKADYSLKTYAWLFNEIVERELMDVVREKTKAKKPKKLVLIEALEADDLPKMTN